VALHKAAARRRQPVQDVPAQAVLEHAGVVEVVGLVVSHPEPAHHGARAGVVLHGERHDLLEVQVKLVEGERRRRAGGLGRKARALR